MTVRKKIDKVYPRLSTAASGISRLREALAEVDTTDMSAFDIVEFEGGVRRMLDELQATHSHLAQALSDVVRRQVLHEEDEAA